MTFIKNILKIFLQILFVVFIDISIYPQSSVRFGVIGDYGESGSDELAVANLVKSWNPDFIITLGDNNYNDGLWATIDENIGQYYHEFIFPYSGSYGQASDINRFFPSPGNHDHHNLVNLGYLQPYLDYFDLFPYSATSGNERYYDFTWENVHFFSINSCVIEPDGYTHPSVQSAWLETQLTNCSLNHSHWKIVYFHHAPYSSGRHGSVGWMQWPFKEWGADVVMAAHDHTYERIIYEEFPYFVNGLGGRSKYNFDPPIPGSIIRYNTDYGAMLVEANTDSINFKFYSISDGLVDSYTLYNTTTNVEPLIPIVLKLEQNYPNPFNPSTTIKFTISDLRFTSLKIYDILGTEVTTLVDEVKPAGTYEVEFNLESGIQNPASGIYFYQLKAGNFIETKKMILLK